MNNNEPYVLFVCEHGSAKSVLAATHFNKLAREKSLGIRAISRGTDPDEEIPSNVRQGLEGDRLIPDEAKPVLLREEDVSGAISVITFCTLPQDITEGATFVSWEDVPPVSEDYNNARIEISKRIGKLLGELNATR